MKSSRMIWEVSTFSPCLSQGSFGLASWSFQFNCSSRPPSLWRFGRDGGQAFRTQNPDLDSGKSAEASQQIIDRPGWRGSGSDRPKEEQVSVTRTSRAP
jgi:hypothetical protein